MPALTPSGRCQVTKDNLCVAACLRVARACISLKIPVLPRICGKSVNCKMAAMSPILFEMSADGTPIVVFKHHSSRLPSGEVVHRKAKQTEELLVRNHFVRVETRVVVHDPVPLETLEKCSCHRGSPQERLEDWTTAGPCWVRIGIVQVRSVCAVSLGARLAAGACCRRAVP